jgi:trigger factor
MPEKITVERLPKNRIACTVVLDEAEYAPAEAEALQRFSEHVDIKGFRPGHAPVDMVRQRVPADDLFEEAVRILLRRYMPEIGEKEKINPVIPPKVEVLSKLPLTLKITFIERPEVTVKDGATIAIPKKEMTADPKDVQRVMDSVLQDHKTLTEADRAAAQGDQVTIDFWAADDQGKEIEGMRAVAYGAQIGSKTLLPGFEEELVGLSKGQNKSFTLTLPDKFQAEHLRSKPATFHVTMQKVESVTLPELTDAFAKEKLQSESMDAFKKMIEQSIASQEEQFDRMNRERQLMEEIRKRTKVELADELIEEEVRGMIEEWAQRLEGQGKTIAQTLEEQKKKPEDVEKEMKEQAVERWKLRLGIAKLIEEKEITVTPEELESAFAQFLANLPEDQHAGAQSEWTKRGALYEEVRWRAMVDKLIEGLLA